LSRDYAANSTAEEVSMKMPYLGILIWRERFFDLTVDQVAQFESIVVKEVAANAELLKKLEGRLGDLGRFRGTKEG
jgi:hypothetical protein